VLRLDRQAIRLLPVGLDLLVETHRLEVFAHPPDPAVGLELAYRRAAPGTKSAVTGAFLATVFVGDLFGGMFAQLYGRVSPGAYFLLQVVIAMGAALAFGWVARRDEGTSEGSIERSVAAKLAPEVAPEMADRRQHLPGTV
jgi:hypothetical protein